MRDQLAGLGIPGVGRRTSPAETLAWTLLHAESALRWRHVCGVGQLAEDLYPGQTVIQKAAWLHDIGYARVANRTGFHPLDGARYLQDHGWPEEVISLVAHHTGAAFEAEERRLSRELSEFAPPDPGLLDRLTYLDLRIGPNGSPVSPRKRIDEILNRYSADSPVHRAVTRSRSHLLGAAERGRSGIAF